MDHDKTLLKNWRPISLLNVNLKTISKVFASRLKTMLTSIIYLEQTADIEKRFIGEGGRLISDIQSATSNLKIKSYLVTTHIEKAFDSLDHSFLIFVLKKFGFGEVSLIGSKYFCITKNCVYWTVVLRQGILILEKVHVKLICFLHFYSILHYKSFFTHQKRSLDQRYYSLWLCFSLYSTCRWFNVFLKDLASVKNLLDIFSHYLKYPGLKPNFFKCEVAGIGSLKGVEMAVCGIKCVNLRVNTINIFGIQFQTEISLTWKKIS